MHDSHRRILKKLAGTLGAALCAGFIYEQLRGFWDKRKFPPPGRLVSVGSHRLHILCKGTGGPPVVIEQGAGGPGILSFELQDQISRFTSVCVYDRAGYEWSDAAPLGRGLTARVQDLYALLNRAEVPPPYILVAHSYGGILARLFAQKYRSHIAGLVLVDTVTEDVYRRPALSKQYLKFEMALVAQSLAAFFGGARLWRYLRPRPNPNAPPEWTGALHATLGAPTYFSNFADDLSSLRSRTENWISDLDTPEVLGDLPLVVITHGTPFGPPLEQLELHWRKGQEQLTKLSCNSVLLVAEHSGHLVFNEDPAVVVEAVRRVIRAVNTGSSVQRSADSA